MRPPVRLRRTYRGVYLTGRRRYILVKWLAPGVRAIRCGIGQVQASRLLVRLSWKLRLHQECGTCTCRRKG